MSCTSSDRAHWRRTLLSSSAWRDHSHSSDNRCKCDTFVDAACSRLAHLAHHGPLGTAWAAVTGDRTVAVASFSASIVVVVVVCLGMAAAAFVSAAEMADWAWLFSCGSLSWPEPVVVVVVP